MMYPMYYDIILRTLVTELYLSGGVFFTAPIKDIFYEKIHFKCSDDKIVTSIQTTMELNAQCYVLCKGPLVTQIKLLDPIMSIR